MAEGQLIADGMTPWIEVQGRVHISINGTFGSGTVTLKTKDYKGAATNLLDNGTAITITTADDSYYNLGPGDSVALSLSGATNPVLSWSIR